MEIAFEKVQLNGDHVMLSYLLWITTGWVSQVPYLVSKCADWRGACDYVRVVAIASYVHVHARQSLVGSWIMDLLHDLTTRV